MANAGQQQARLANRTTETARFRPRSPKLLTGPQASCNMNNQNISLIPPVDQGPFSVWPLDHTLYHSKAQGYKVRCTCAYHLYERLPATLARRIVSGPVDPTANTPHPVTTATSANAVCRNRHARDSVVVPCTAGVGASQ